MGSSMMSAAPEGDDGADRRPVERARPHDPADTWAVVVLAAGFPDGCVTDAGVPRGGTPALGSAFEHGDRGRAGGGVAGVVGALVLDRVDPGCGVALDPQLA